MDRKTKLAQCILLEVEALKVAQGIERQLTLAEEITKDAIELAKLIEQENKLELKNVA